jgi:hypothetical protein
MHDLLFIMPNTIYSNLEPTLLYTFTDFDFHVQSGRHGSDEDCLHLRLTSSHHGGFATIM